MPQGLSSEQKLECFLNGIARERNLSASTQNQAFNAILSFYKEVLHQPLQGIDALRAKRPVHLRHATTLGETQALLQSVRNVAGYATHYLERGTNPRAIQQAMGHKSLETTMGYLHAESLSVQSPLEALPLAPAAAAGCFKPGILPAKTSGQPSAPSLRTQGSATANTQIL